MVLLVLVVLLAARLAMLFYKAYRVRLLITVRHKGQQHDQ
jgi:hypothetical protein